MRRQGARYERLAKPVHTDTIKIVILLCLLAVLKQPGGSSKHEYRVVSWRGPLTHSRVEMCKPTHRGIAGSNLSTTCISIYWKECQSIVFNIVWLLLSANKWISPTFIVTWHKHFNCIVVFWLNVIEMCN